MDLYYKQRSNTDFSICAAEASTRSNTNIKYNFLGPKWPVGEDKTLEGQIQLDAGQPAVRLVGSFADDITSLSILALPGQRT